MLLSEILCFCCLLASWRKECATKTDVAHFLLPYVSSSRYFIACAHLRTHLRTHGRNYVQLNTNFNELLQIRSLIFGIYIAGIL